MIEATRIGLISDTHGLLRPEAVDALRGSELILHAGDIGYPNLLDPLRALAPVIAIRGNVDTGSWSYQYPATTTVETAAAHIYILHDLNTLNFDPAARGIHIVLSGHSHQPAHTIRNGVHYINPGSAGPRRFKLPITLARLDLAASPWTVDFIDLANPAAQS